MPEWITPLLWPVWWRPTSASFSTTTSSQPGNASSSDTAVAKPDDAAADHTEVVQGPPSSPTAEPPASPDRCIADAADVRDVRVSASMASTRPQSRAVAASIGSAGQPQQRRAMAADPPGQADGAAGPGHQAQRQLGQGEPGGRVGHDPPGEGGQLDAGAHARPVDPDLDPRRQPGDEAGRAAGQADQVRRGRIGEVAELVEVAAAAERRAGSQTALFEVLMRRHNERIYRAARAILRDEHEAEDVMQQTYVNVYSHLRQFDGRSKFYWLTRIAVHEALARARRRGRYMTMDGDESSVGDLPGAFDTTPDPERLAHPARAWRAG